MNDSLVLLRDIEHQAIPQDNEILEAVLAVLEHANIDVQQPDFPEICIRFADDQSVQELNRSWRNKDSVTDVLSFPMQDEPPFQQDEPLGDIILALPFVLEEAKRLELNPTHHMLHLIIHGTLHLLGFDHIADDDAATMQRLEVAIMRQLGLHHPYDHTCS